MSDQTGTSKTEATVDEADVVSYLEQHPEMLMQHPDLLRRLQVPHPSAQGAVSLIERQVSLLREKNRELDDRLATLVENAKYNEDISDKLHRYSMMLSRSENLPDLLSNSLLALQQLFDLDAASVRLKPDTETLPDIAVEYVMAEKAYAALLDSLGASRCSCHTDLDEELLASLFGLEAENIRSCALAALDTPHRIGLLALGSNQRERFTPDMGKMFLERLAELMSAAIGRFQTG